MSIKQHPKTLTFPYAGFKGQWSKFHFDWLFRRSIISKGVWGGRVYPCLHSKCILQPIKITDCDKVNTISYVHLPTPPFFTRLQLARIQHSCGYMLYAQEWGLCGKGIFSVGQFTFFMCNMMELRCDSLYECH